MADADDAFSPWDLYQQEMSRQAATFRNDQLIATWRQLLLDTFTGDYFGASTATLARLMYVVSRADLLLARLAGHGALNVAISFNPEFARLRANEIAGDGHEEHAELLRALADQFGDVAAITPHFLFAALMHWIQDRPFTMEAYGPVLHQLVRTRWDQLLIDLHLVPAGRAEAARRSAQTIDIAPIGVRFEDPAAGLKSPDYGPYSWVEMAQDVLKVAPDGAQLAIRVMLEDQFRWKPINDPQTYSNLVIGAIVPK